LNKPLLWQGFFNGCLGLMAAYAIAPFRNCSHYRLGEALFAEAEIRKKVIDIQLCRGLV